MTREEQLDWLCRLRSEIYVFMPKEWLKPMDEALTASIKTLEQEPKQGHWINDEDTIGCYYCSRCGGYVASYDDAYCKYCGCRMSEVSE